jgi:hypothetical protein
MSYTNLSLHFRKVKHKDVKGVGELIGGKVKINVDNGVFTNACALRLSYALNKADYIIRKTDGAVSSGNDGKWYLYRVSDMIKYAEKIATKTIKGKTFSDFKNKKGIIVFGNCGWSDATGHVDLFDGSDVEGSDYTSSCGEMNLYVLEEK